MTTVKHTPGPWHVEDSGDHYRVASHDPSLVPARTYGNSLGEGRITMTAKHWKIDESESTPLAVIEDTEDGMGVCEVGKPGTKRADATPEEWEAARLIAAAPDLLAALEIIVNSEELETGTFVCDFQSLQSVARAARAKARGE